LKDKLLNFKRASLLPQTWIKHESEILVISSIPVPPGSVVTAVILSIFDSFKNRVICVYIQYFQYLVIMVSDLKKATLSTAICIL